MNHRSIGRRRFVVSFADHRSPEEWPRKCYPAEVSVDSIESYPYLSPSGFSTVSTDRRKLACWRILRRGGTGNSLAYVEQKLFSQRAVRHANLRGRTMYPSSPSSVLSRKVFPHAGFWATRPDGGKTSLRAVDIHVGVDVGASASRASATRASFLFCRNYFPGRAFCLISAPCSPPVPSFSPLSTKRGASRRV